ncbi:putative lipid II flippase FtsW [Rickettsiales endosymbiont of Stachyamoeba lipophora]|uniref:putative lipid II flippase FtsW n=1 Tax=Rickettsiales endosymbiont of Stachyamoeba lipophora TaxID=2486578 RepID=UPI000F6541AE|nr:putative lipid II flippase FtsW [Rickettsiales endosymbiont of Stachyamoeba lipophora]AZL15459.1 putative lipid II flippase FtsW [Rickettsiales endosymbiont of Stachyamoeba lipophora]
MKAARSRNNFIYSWWWSIDRIALVSVLIMIAFSAFMVATASPAVAERIGLEPFYFIRKQIIYLMLAVLIIFSTSLLSIDNIKRLSILGFSICILLLLVTLIVGVEVKGSKRWINLMGFSMQPSEFIKPFFSIMTALLISQKYRNYKFPAFSVSIGLFVLTAMLIIIQPDFGMSLTLGVIWGGQLFIGGISFFWIILSLIGGGLAALLGYLFLPHVARRIDNFLYPEATENYQVSRSMEAFISGGFSGKGPGEGVVKQVIPDSHTDFIFAVVGEELGLITCVLVIFLYASFIIRGFYRILDETDMFVICAISGVLIQFGFQTIVNMGVTINMLPTKGMTLPFISYGGSSMMAMSIAIGILLALTKRRFYSHSYKLRLKKMSYQVRELN